MAPARSNIVAISSEYQRDLVWSFQPIFYLMRILGIDLNWSQSPTKFRRYGFLAVALFMLAYTVTANSFQFYMNDISRHPISTIFRVELLRKEVTGISNILFLIIVICKSLLNWKPLWQKVQKMENRLNYKANSLWQLRKVVIVTSAIVIIYILLVKSDFLL